jgi:osmotically-inducible protein OsmY
MNFLSQLFSSKYNDAQLVEQATKAITADPQTRDSSSLLVSSKKGVVTLSGIVPKEQDKGRIEEYVRNALANHDLNYEGLINELKIPYQ